MTGSDTKADAWPAKTSALTATGRTALLAAMHREVGKIVPWNTDGDRGAVKPDALAALLEPPETRDLFQERKGDLELQPLASKDYIGYGLFKADEKTGTATICLEGQKECLWVAGSYTRAGEDFAIALSAATIEEIEYEKEHPEDFGRDEALAAAVRNKAMERLGAEYGVDDKPLRLRVKKHEVREAYDELDGASDEPGRPWITASSPMATLLANAVGGLSLPDRGLEKMEALLALGKAFGAVENRTITLDARKAVEFLPYRHVDRFGRIHQDATTAMKDRLIASEIADAATKGPARPTNGRAEAKRTVDRDR